MRRNATNSLAEEKEMVANLVESCARIAKNCGYLSQIAQSVNLRIKDAINRGSMKVRHGAHSPKIHNHADQYQRQPQQHSPIPQQPVAQPVQYTPQPNVTQFTQPRRSQTSTVISVPTEHNQLHQQFAATHRPQQTQAVISVPNVQTASVGYQQFPVNQFGQRVIQNVQPVNTTITTAQPMQSVHRAQRTIGTVTYLPQAQPNLVYQQPQMMRIG